MAENLISKLIPHQGCVITRTGDGIEIAGSAMNWVMSAAVAPLVCQAPFTFRVVGKTDSTNLRMHWHRGELIFNWECSVRELRARESLSRPLHEPCARSSLTWSHARSNRRSKPRACR